MDGVYLATFDERRGDCGSFEQLVALSPEDELDPECTGMRRMPTACDLEQEISCPNYNELGDLIGYFGITGTMSQVNGPDRAEGSVSIRLYDTSRSLICAGTGYLTYARQ